MNAVLDSAVDLLKSRVKAKQATIEKQWDEEIESPESAASCGRFFPIWWPTAWTQSRSTARSSCGFPEARFQTMAVAAVRVTVADDGKGITADALPHLFEPFFTTKGAVGTGLGLWVSKQIIDNHGGTIRVRSSTEGVRRGTVFSVSFPSSL